MSKVPRLIQFFTPSHYDLKLDLQREARTFNGSVMITGQADEHAIELALHAKDLVITHFELNGTEINPSKLTHKDDVVSCELPKDLQGKEVKVRLEFNSHITDPMHGLYPCYFTTNGKKKELLATQFESHHAREVFPCIDEPEAKATFDLTLVTETGVEVLGNMPVKESSEDGRLKTTFETSPKMSTYLLAFVVGEMHCVEAKAKNGAEVRIWSTKNHPKKNLQFALDTATKCIDFFDEYFDVPYPLPKSDHVALPDFSSGAMENWGLITYREVCLLVDEATTSQAVKEFVALVICHELSHQWFGNLVTMKWWNDLWLNESFACLMEYVAVDAIYPEWDIWLTFASREALSSMRRDSLPGVQPVHVDVNHPDEITSLFDPDIVYAKGARLLYMLLGFVGEEAFKNGLKHYFETHAYGNTAGSDLWAALTKSSSQQIDEFMDPWLTQPHYPLLNVERHGNEYQLSQRPFVIGADVQPTSRWPLPLLSPNPDLPRLLYSEQLRLPAHTDEVIELNTGRAGYYSIHYPQEDLKLLAVQVENNELKPTDRLMLLNDSLLQARAGLHSIASTLELVEHYRNESRESVWDMLALVIADTRRIAELDEPTEARLKSFVGKLVAPLVDKFGWDKEEGESPETTKLRALVVGLGLFSEEKVLIQEALSRFEQSSPEELPAEIRGDIMATAVKFGNGTHRKTLLELHHKSSNPELRQDIAMSLCATRDLEFANKLLAMLKDASVVRLQDVDRWVIGLLRNRHTRLLAWEWIQENWTWIEEQFGSDKSYDHYPRYAALIFNTRHLLKQYKDFFGPMQTQPALERTITIGLKEIENRVKWCERDFKPLGDYLHKLD